MPKDQGFQALIEAAKEEVTKKKTGGNSLSLELFDYIVPEDKQHPDFEGKTEERMKALESSCRSGLVNHRR